MELFVKEAIKRVGETFPFLIEETVADVEFDKRSLQFAKPVRVEGGYVFDGKAFSVFGRVDAELNSICARCNESFIEPVSFEFSERFVRSGAAFSDEDAYEYAGDRLEISRAVMDNLLLQLPIASVCKEDCCGLCRICGINLNRERCSCEHELAH
ncbi:MAG: DUF177 domain-containing protein [Clostridia bacterium]|nr:DUF177 domain-containing protein [Clostridia bacterium]